VSTIFEENLASLHRRHKQAAQELPPGPSGSLPSLDRTTGLEDLLQKKGTGGRVILLGLGSGHEVVRWWQQVRHTIDLLVIFEEDTQRAKAVLSQVPFTDIIDDGRVHLFLALPAEEIQRNLYPLRYAFGTSSPTILELADCPGLAAFRRALEEELLLFRQSAELVIHEKGRMLFNVLRNLPAIVTGTPVQNLRGRLKGEPAFVVAAGPSLDKNISLLPQACERGWLIAVDTALAPLRQAGVVPQILVTCDPTALNERHFRGWPDLQTTVLAFHPEVHAEIPRMYLGKARLLVLHDRETSLLRALGLAPAPGEGVARGVMTGHLAFNLAVYLGCDPIVLVGMDLALPPAGGSTHAAGTALGRPVRTIQGSKAIVGAVPGLPGESETDLVELPGIDGGTVLGPAIFRTYLRLMDQEIARSGCRVIDATEGGTRKARTEVMALKRAIGTVGRTSGPAISPPIGEGPSVPVRTGTMLEVLSQGRHRLIELKQWASERHDITEWRSHLLSDPDDWLLPAYESLIYKAYDLRPSLQQDQLKAQIDDLTKQLISMCDCFSLFILGAEKELANLQNGRWPPSAFHQ